MAGFTERPGDMRPRDRDGFDFRRSQAEAASARQTFARRTARVEGRPGPDTGTVALAIGAMAFYWLMPMLMRRRRPPPPPPPPAPR